MSRFRQAKRQMTYMKFLSIAVSGGGKSMTSLEMATGFRKRLEQLDGKEHRVAYINSEPNRGELYADKYDYDILDLKPPYEPENYIEAIDDAIEEGYDILVVDSLSHEWAGKGGCLEIHNNTPGKDAYMKWGKVSPRHEAFMEKLLDSPVHIFATVRGKDAYERTEYAGKVKYEKVAVGYTQRKDLEYLFITSVMIDLKTHYAEALKDNTGLFSTTKLLKEKDGVKLCDWAYNTTADDVRKMKEEQQQALDKIKSEEEQEFADGGIYGKQAKIELSDVVTDILKDAKELAGMNLRQEAIDIIGGSGDPRKITDLNQALEIKEKLQNLKGQ